MLKYWFWVIIFSLLFGVGCISLPKESVELSDVTAQQIAELNKSHIRFVKLYYGKLRSDMNEFINDKWVPLFLSKAVKNRKFRRDLDEAYATSNIKTSDIQISWNGPPLKEPQKSVVLRGVGKAIQEENGRLGQILLDFSRAVQEQISKKRKELLDPIDEQEKFVINQINSAFYDLQQSQAAIKAHLASAVNLKEKREQTLAKMGVLDKVNNIVNAVAASSEKLSSVLESDEGAPSHAEILNMIKLARESVEKAAGSSGK